MKRNLACLLLITTMLLFAGCHKKQVQEKPENLIGRSTMVKLIAESYLIESVVGMNPEDTLNRFKSTKEYYKDLFDRYHVTREQFNKSIEYYMGDEEDAEKLLSEASTLIMKKKQKMALQDTIAQQVDVDISADVTDQVPVSAEIADTTKEKPQPTTAE